MHHRVLEIPPESCEFSPAEVLVLDKFEAEIGGKDVRDLHQRWLIPSA